MTPKGFAEMSFHQGTIDDASLLECHRCDAPSDDWVGQTLFYPRSVLPSSCRNEMQDELREDSSDKHFVYVNHQRGTFK